MDQSHHALACASCGAPLRNLKQLPKPAPRRNAVTHQPRPQGFAKITPVEKVREAKPSKPPKRRKAKNRKGWFGKKFKDLAEDIFDVVEDIFD